MGSTETTNIWASGEAYEAYVGRWSRVVARAFLSWLAVPTGRRWLDVGCGTGALSGVILEEASAAQVVGIDPSTGFLAAARSRVSDPRARFAVGDACALPVPSAAFDAVVAGLVLNFVSDPAAAVAEMARAARPGRVVGVYVWDYAGGMELVRWFWDAAVAVDTEASALAESRRFAAVCNPDALVTLFQGAGLKRVEARAVDVPTVFRDFDDYWTPFLGGQGPAPSYAMSLSAEHREAVREHLRTSLPVAADGSISLGARAWAVRGKR